MIAFYFSVGFLSRLYRRKIALGNQLVVAVAIGLQSATYRSPYTFDYVWQSRV